MLLEMLSQYARPFYACFRPLALLALATTTLAAAVFFWLLSLDGTIGLFLWDMDNRHHFYLLAASALLPLLCYFWIIGNSSLDKSKPGLYLFLLVLGICAAIPSGYAAFVLAKTLPKLPSTPPLLLVTDSRGKYGIPDLALVWRNSTGINRMTTNDTATLIIDNGENLEILTANRESGGYVIPLRNLQPNGHYRWQLTGQTRGSFFTPPLGKDASHIICRFAVGADMHFGEPSANVSATRGILGTITESATPYHYFFFLGDVQRLGMENKQWQTTLAFLSPYTFLVPFKPVMGNHEALIGGKSHYLSYFHPPRPETHYGSPLYYRIDIGNVNILMLYLLWDSREFRGEQKKWLKRQLADIPHDNWIFVMCHASIYASGTNPKRYSARGEAAGDNQMMIRDVAPLLAKRGVDAVFTGHNHHLEALVQAGVHYFIVGGMGGVLDNELSYISNSSLWRCQTHGFAEVVVFPNYSTITFRTPAGEIIKAFIIEKGGSKG